MRTSPVEFVSEINKRGPISSRTFLTFIAKNRNTGADERLCLWTGADHQDFAIEGVTATYYGAGSVMSLGNIKQEIGTNIRKYSMTLSHLTPEVAMLLRGYELKFAQAFIHTCLFSIESELPVTPFVRRFKGWVEKAPMTTAAKGGTSSAKLELVSFARNLTRLVPAKRSNENQKKRNANDAFLRYAGISGKIKTDWGLPK